MMTWLRNRLRRSYQNVRRFGKDVVQDTRRLGKNAVQDTGHGLKGLAWTARSSWDWTKQSAVDGASAVRSLPLATKMGMLRMASVVGFARSHPGVRRFIFGLPALASVAVFITGVSLYYQLDRAEFLARYRAEADLARQGKYYDAARLRYRRLAGETDYPLPVVYHLAQSLEGLGQTDRAEELFDRLSPHASGGYPAAHIRKAKILLAKEPLTPDDIRRAEAQLLFAEAGTGPDQDEAHALLGQFYWHFGAFNDAKAHLLLAEKARPEMSLPLARVCAVLKIEDEKVLWARRAITYFEIKANANPDDMEYRLHWADALLMIGRNREAIDVLRQGLARADNFTVRQLIADLCGKRYDDLRGDQNAGAERLEVILDGIKLVPNNGHLLYRLADAARVPGPDGQRAQQAIDQRLADKTTEVAMTLALANYAQWRKEPTTALSYLERAIELEPKSPVIANNLAWLLATRPDPDLERALKMSEVAVAEAPPNDLPALASYRDTRGQILVKLGRYEDALTDLVYALPHFLNSADIHLALSEAYRATNQNSKADAHKLRAEELQKERPKVGQN
jgi:thioredoxin-like negative regulator of GroEL